MKGVDVSYHNGVINWSALVTSGIRFAIVRSSYGKTGKDPNFLRNVNEAHEHGLICGAYHYSYALNEADAILEAQNCREVIDSAGVMLELPVWFDMEDADQYKARNNFNFTRANVTAICKKFLDNIGLNTGIYASYSWLQDYIDWKSLGCSVWNAQWGKYDDLGGYMWQYTENLYIGGKRFDGNIMYDEEDSHILRP